MGEKLNFFGIIYTPEKITILFKTHIKNNKLTNNKTNYILEHFVFDRKKSFKNKLASLYVLKTWMNLLHKFATIIGDYFLFEYCFSQGCIKLLISPWLGKKINGNSAWERNGKFFSGEGNKRYVRAAYW